MSVDAETNFASAIQEHLDLKQRNADLGGDMPIDRYAVEDPFENHPLFKSEEQARLEETLESAVDEPVADAVLADAAGVESSPLPWPGEESTEGPALAGGLWNTASRDFDWGD
jgi:hypothetical protein